MKNDPSPEVQDMEMFPAPKKEDVKVIDVDAKTLVQDVIEKKIWKECKVTLKVRTKKILKS